MLGHILFRGYANVGPDKTRAFQCWLAAANKGHHAAAEAVSGCYKSGEGVGADENELRGWADRAEELRKEHTPMFFSQESHAPSPHTPSPHTPPPLAPQDASSHSASNTPEKVPADFASWEQLLKAGTTEARVHSVCKRLEEICDEDEAPAEALCLLAYAYTRGLVTGKASPADTARLYLDAVKQHQSPHAAYELAMLYEKGDGVPQRRKEAFRYFLLAAESGCAPAFAELARCYEQGIGTKRDATKATNWRSKVVEDKVN